MWYIVLSMNLVDQYSAMKLTRGTSYTPRTKHLGPDGWAKYTNRLFLESSPMPVKWALSEMKLIPPGIRLPLVTLAEEHHQPLREAMQQAGVLA